MKKQRIHFAQEENAFEMTSVEMEHRVGDLATTHRLSTFMRGLVTALNLFIWKEICQKYKNKLVRNFLKKLFKISVVKMKYPSSKHLDGKDVPTVVNVHLFNLVILLKPISNKRMEKYSFFSPVRKGRDAWYRENCHLETASKNLSNYLKDD